MLLPELAEGLAARPLADRRDIVAHRSRVRANVLANQWPADPRRVVVRDVLVDRPEQASLRVRTYRPAGTTDEVPMAGVLWVHGGAFSTGLPEADDQLCCAISEQVGALVVSPDYRLAPEYPFPAGFEDVVLTLNWLAKLCGGKPLAVGGASAGATLAAAAALKARDVGGPRLAVQLLVQPALDNRMTPAQRALYADSPVFNSADADLMWRRYLPDDDGEVAHYAVPARVADVVGLPFTYIQVAEDDPLRNGAIAYAERLSAAGVPTELRDVPGTCHGFDSLVPDAVVSRSAVGDCLEVLVRHLGSQSP